MIDSQVSIIEICLQAGGGFGVIFTLFWDFLNIIKI